MRAIDPPPGIGELLSLDTEQTADGVLDRAAYDTMQMTKALRISDVNDSITGSITLFFPMAVVTLALVTSSETPCPKRSRHFVVTNDTWHC